MIDRAKLIEQSARLIAANSGPMGTHYLDIAQSASAAVLPVIADALLGEMEALHQRAGSYDLADECGHSDDAHEVGYDESGEAICLTTTPTYWVCAECHYDDGEAMEYPCATARLCRELRKVVAGDEGVLATPESVKGLRPAISSSVSAMQPDSRPGLHPCDSRPSDGRTADERQS